MGGRRSGKERYLGHRALRRVASTRHGSPATSRTSTRSSHSTRRKRGACRASSRWRSWPPTRRSRTPDSSSTTRTRTASGVIVGSGIGGLQLMEEQHVILLEKGPSRLTPVYGAHDDRRPRCRTCLHASGSQGHQLLSHLGVCYRQHRHRRGRRGDSPRHCGCRPCRRRRCRGDHARSGGLRAARSLSTRNDDPQGASRPWDCGP